MTVTTPTAANTAKAREFAAANWAAMIAGVEGTGGRYLAGRFTSTAHGNGLGGMADLMLAFVDLATERGRDDLAAKVQQLLDDTAVAPEPVTEVIACDDSAGQPECTAPATHRFTVIGLTFNTCDAHRDSMERYLERAIAVPMHRDLRPQFGQEGACRECGMSDHHRPTCSQR